jgi:hypothetical protein
MTGAGRVERCLIVLVVGMALLPVVTVQAQEPPFTETFEDPALPGWERSPDVVALDEGVLLVPPDGFAFYAGEWGDQTLTVRVRRSGEGFLAVGYRMGSRGGYFLLIGDTSVAVQRQADGALTELGTAPLEPIPEGEWVLFTVSAVGSEHQVALGQEGVLAVTDPDPLPPGGVVLEALEGAVGEFDDLAIAVEAAAPPRQVILDAVEPAEGDPGQEFELALIGSGFEGATDVEVTVGEFEVLATRIESDEVIRARVYVPEDAPPGPRPVELVVFLEDEPFGLGLERGFLVREREPVAPPTTAPPTTAPPTRQPGTDERPRGDIDWIWPGAAVALSGLSFALGRVLAVKSRLTWTDKARVQWRVQAESQLPEATRACQWACKANVSADLLDRWQVTRVKLTPLRLPGGTPPQGKHVEGQVLAPLNDLANLSQILQRTDEVRRRLAPIVDALVEQVMTWGREGQTPAAFRVEAELKAPIKAEFGLYHCSQIGQELGWGKPLLSWKGKLNQPGGEFLGVVRGPAAGEEDYAARVRRELEACLLDLVGAARFRL